MKTELEVRLELNAVQNEYDKYKIMYDKKAKRYQENVARFGPLANTSEMNYYYNILEDLKDKIFLLEWVLN